MKYWIDKVLRFFLKLLGGGEYSVSTQNVMQPIENSKGRFAFYCPGCSAYHIINTAKGNLPRHTITGPLSKPTVRASVLSKGDTRIGKPHCHSFITRGRIEFLEDCTHNLAGQTVDLLPV